MLLEDGLNRNNHAGIHRDTGPVHCLLANQMELITKDGKTCASQKSGTVALG